MERLFNRTNDLQNLQKKLEVKVKTLNANPAQAFSVQRKSPPQFARSSCNQRSKPDQVRRQVRICYNCKKPGHFAASCSRFNPRSPLSAGINPKPTLSSLLKNKQPATNSVESSVIPETSVKFGTALVSVQSNGNYTPFVYPNGSSNHLMKDYTWAELNKPVTPYGS